LMMSNSFPNRINKFEEIHVIFHIITLIYILLLEKE